MQLKSASQVFLDSVFLLITPFLCLQMHKKVATSVFLHHQYYYYTNYTVVLVFWVFFFKKTTQYLKKSSHQTKKKINKLKCPVQ